MSEPELVTAKELTLNANNQRERNILVVEREFSMTQRRAHMLASSSIVPKDYQNNIANCVIACEMANRLNAGELEIMQNLHIIHGRPSFSASYLIAQVNNSGILEGRIQFKMTGQKGSDSWGCIAFGKDKETGEILEGTEITIKLAIDEGWMNKSGSKWKTMPEQMLKYRAAAFWSRIYAPDATMGMHTMEEVQDVQEKDITPHVTQLSSVQAMLDEKRKVDTETGEITEPQNTSEAATPKDATTTATPASKQVEEEPAPVVEDEPPSADSMFG